eukprot:2982390-Prorocentrum_lima.AAC.1
MGSGSYAAPFLWAGVHRKQAEAPPPANGGQMAVAQHCRHVETGNSSNFLFPAFEVRSMYIMVMH